MVLYQMSNYYKSRRWSFPHEGRWVSPIGKCQILLHPTTQSAVDYFSPHMIAVKAGEVLDQCVTRGNHLGGVVTIGARKVFDVLITHPDDGPVQAIDQVS